MLAELLFLFKDLLFFFGVVQGRGSFPKPLSAKEERDALEKLKAGDEAARQLLIEHNLRLVSHVVRKYRVPGYTQDDLVSVGALGLIKAVNTFKPETGASLATYAARCIENEVLMLLRASKKRASDVSLTDPIGTDGEGNDISFADIRGTPPDAVEEAAITHVAIQKALSALKALPKRERVVVAMRFGLLDGRAHPQHEVAKTLGISRSYVSRLEKRAIERLREALDDGPADRKPMSERIDK